MYQYQLLSINNNFDNTVYTFLPIYSRITNFFNMALIKIALVSCAILLVCHLATTQAATIERQLPEMRSLGTIGNKRFYTTVDTTFKVNWLAARSICNQSGYEFAIFHEDAEFNFVRDQVEGSAKLWIDASMKDMESITGRGAFVYGDGSEVATKNVMINPAQWVCLYFSADDHIFTDMCISGQQGVLCQSRTI